MHHHITRRGLLVGTAAIGVGGLGLGAFPAFAQQAGDAAGRTYHALLVAVTAYPNLPPKASLVGPNNDASLVREFLLNNAPVRFEPENVSVLADGIDSNGAPTRGSIRSALDGLAGKVKAGDFVYLQFSGHGTQQPAIDPSIEPDGLDEVFLPSDTGMWQDRAKGIPNALIDKEIRDHLQAIRDKGAFIWAVFDCCHSGTMTRAITDGDETERKIDFTDLGIPEAAMAEAIATLLHPGQLWGLTRLEAPQATVRRRSCSAMARSLPSSSVRVRSQPISSTISAAATPGSTMTGKSAGSATKAFPRSFRKP